MKLTDILKDYKKERKQIDSLVEETKRLLIEYLITRDRSFEPLEIKYIVFKMFHGKYDITNFKMSDADPKKMTVSFHIKNIIQNRIVIDCTHRELSVSDILNDAFDESE